MGKLINTAEENKVSCLSCKLGSTSYIFFFYHTTADCIERNIKRQNIRWNDRLKKLRCNTYPRLLITMPIDLLVSVDLFLIVMACQSQPLKSHVMNQLGRKRTHKCHYPAKALWASPYGSQPCPIPHHRSPPLPAPFLLLSAEVWAKLANLFYD